jgi:hypothetical protein
MMPEPLTQEQIATILLGLSKKGDALAAAVEALPVLSQPRELVVPIGQLEDGLERDVVLSVRFASSVA